MKLSYYIVESSLKDGRLLLINTKSESYLVLSKALSLNYFEYKENKDISHLDQTLKEALVESSFLIEKSTDEYATIVERHWNARKVDNRILRLTIATTLGCNLRCGYCFEKDKHTTHLSIEEEDSIFRFISKELVNIDEGLEIFWFGGEPLLSIKSIERLSKKMIRFCTFHGKTYASTIITNGVLLTEENAKILKNALVSSVQITLDGDKELHDKMRPKANQKGSYDEVIAGVLVARKYFRTSIRINLSQNNIDSVIVLLHNLAELELFDVYISFAPIVAPEDEVERDESFYLTREAFANYQVQLTKLLKELGFRVASSFGGTVNGYLPCTALDRHSYIIEPRGYINKCVEFVGNVSKSVGNLSKGELSLSDNMNLWEQYNLFTFPQMEGEEDCNNCKYLPICYGDCPTKRISGHNKEKYLCTPARFNLARMIKVELDME